MSRHFLYYLLLVSSGLMCWVPSAAQKKETDSTLAGIYRTYQDFTEGKLSYNIDCSREKQKIRLHAFMQKPFLDVFYKGEKIRLLKAELFGYQDCEGNVFRFYCNQEYQLAEIRDLSIYFIDDNVPTGASYVHERVFYFCFKPDGPLMPLTLQNLQTAFLNNRKFLGLLNNKITKESDLWEYDELRRIFMVNHLYALSKQQ